MRGLVLAVLGAAALPVPSASVGAHVRALAEMRQRHAAELAALVELGRGPDPQETLTPEGIAHVIQTTIASMKAEIGHQEQNRYDFDDNVQLTVKIDKAIQDLEEGIRALEDEETSQEEKLKLANGFKDEYNFTTPEMKKPQKPFYQRLLGDWG